jgi:hypothetical protein
MSELKEANDRLLRLITCQADALVEAEKLICWQMGEIARLREGNFTPEEFQNICHNLPPSCGPAEFRRGCRDYQRRLFGPEAVTALEREEAGRAQEEEGPPGDGGGRVQE